MRLGLAQTLAEYMAADHIRLAQVNAQALTDIVRDVTREGAA